MPVAADLAGRPISFLHGECPDADGYDLRQDFSVPLRGTVDLDRGDLGLG
jgi:hypothetical protein